MTGYPVSPELIIATQMYFKSQLAIFSRKISTKLEIENKVGYLAQMLDEIELCARKWENATQADYDYNWAQLNAAMKAWKNDYVTK